MVELSNQYGVDKLPCSPQRLDPEGAVLVTLELRRAAGGAVEWITNRTLSRRGLRAGSTLVVTVPPGNTSFVAFSRSDDRIR